MTVQDDERERELCALFGLQWDAAHARGGVDAVLPNVRVNGQAFRFEVEVKSSTSELDIGTARDFGMEHISRWRKMLFIFGFYTKDRGRPELQQCLVLTPLDMEPWLAGKEAQMLVDSRLAARVPRGLQLEDLFAVCGEEESYSIEDAKKLLKRQYSAVMYQQAADLLVDGVPRISKSGMLELLKQRALYIARRGSTLNNTHVGKTFLQDFVGTKSEVIDRTECAPRLREIAADFVREFPGHPAAVLET